MSLLKQHTQENTVLGTRFIYRGKLFIFLPTLCLIWVKNPFFYS